MSERERERHRERETERQKYSKEQENNETQEENKSLLPVYSDTIALCLGDTVNWSGVSLVAWQSMVLEKIPSLDTNISYMRRQGDIHGGY